MKPLPTLTWLLLCTLLALAPALQADSKADTMKAPVNAAAPLTEKELRVQLEAEYRAAFERGLAKEKESYEGSLRSLWMSNAAVWTVLLLFIVLQALSARKRAADIERLHAARESGS